MSQVALRQGVGNVGQLAAVVAVLERTDVHVAPLLQLLEPAALLLALAVGVQHDAYPQCTWGMGGIWSVCTSPLQSLCHKIIIMIITLEEAEKAVYFVKASYSILLFPQ